MLIFSRIFDNVSALLNAISAWSPAFGPFPLAESLVFFTIDVKVWMPDLGIRSWKFSLPSGVNLYLQHLGGRSLSLQKHGDLMPGVQVHLDLM